MDKGLEAWNLHPPCWEPGAGAAAESALCEGTHVPLRVPVQDNARLRSRSQAEGGQRRVADWRSGIGIATRGGEATGFGAGKLLVEERTMETEERRGLPQTYTERALWAEGAATGSERAAVVGSTAAAGRRAVSGGQ